MSFFPLQPPMIKLYHKTERKGLIETLCNKLDTTHLFHKDETNKAFKSCTFSRLVLSQVTEVVKKRRLWYWNNKNDIGECDFFSCSVFRGSSSLFWISSRYSVILLFYLVLYIYLSSLYTLVVSLYIYFFISEWLFVLLVIISLETPYIP